MINGHSRIAQLAATITLTASCVLTQSGFAQDAAAQSARETAPIDLTGHWVSLITDDWVYRMLTPSAGDYSFVPLNDAGRRQADTWNPQRDAAAGDDCKAYGAPAIMRMPGRVQISWEGDNTLQLDFDTGMQTRLFHFDQQTASGPRTLQGFSAASWEFSGDINRQLVFGGARTSLGSVSVTGSLRVDTSNLRAGYLRKNGVPFSENTFMTEYYNVIVEEDGNQYLVIQTYVDDPTYLRQHFVRTMQFKREPNGSKRQPLDCGAANELSYLAGGVPSPDEVSR